MKTIFRAIAQKLKSDIAGVFVDFWNNQPAKQAENVLLTPAVFLEFADINFSYQSSGVQTASVKLNTHIVLECYSDSFEGAESQEQALVLYDFVEQVYLSLQGFSQDNFTALNRIALKTDSNYDNVLIFEISWEFIWIDNSKALAEASLYDTLTPDISVNP
ncbi:MAG: hypothetical protein SFU27_06435 [Thermonemataceae bacterium]|nr:hypothetical protein [Thermonemataceae bacterium]